jgi:hypothetical protein
MKSVTKSRALFLHRDSGGKAEMTPTQYVEWGQQQAEERGLAFDGTADRIAAMIREGQFSHGDLYLDYDAKGNLLSRAGLDALIEEALADPCVTHVLIPRRDRLARPDDPLDGIRLENILRLAGKTIVYMDRVLPPLKKGKKADIAELITAVVDFDQAEKFRRDLAQKILYAQLQLARLGFSTGGRPPYGFRRWLVKNDGTQVRELADKERVRMPDHHVAWLPTAQAELSVVLRILQMLETMPASQVAKRLTTEGVPSPDAGKWRKDRGHKHPVSGVWHQTTVTNIARNKLLVAVASFGLRSMGDKLRFSLDGPRELDDADFRQDDKPKVIRNPEDRRITVPASFDPVVDPEQHRRLIAKLDARAGTQRGKARSRDPANNPLGGQIFDMGCSWPMYRMPYGQTFRYKCGLYLQSHGAQCSHNTVDGPIASRFVLSCIRQRLLSPTFRLKVERRFRELAEKETSDQNGDLGLSNSRVQLVHVRSQLTTVANNMALAKTSSQFDAMSTTFDQLKAQEVALQAQVAQGESRSERLPDIETEIATAIDIVERLTDLAARSGGLDLAGEAFRLTKARLFLKFEPVQKKRRLLNKVAGGVVVFGDAPDPVQVYRGPTGRRAMCLSSSGNGGPENASQPHESTIGSGSEGNSLRNVSRGDWI